MRPRLAKCPRASTSTIGKRQLKPCHLDRAILACQPGFLCSGVWRCSACCSCPPVTGREPKASTPIRSSSSGQTRPTGPFATTLVTAWRMRHQETHPPPGLTLPSRITKRTQPSVSMTSGPMPRRNKSRYRPRAACICFWRPSWRSLHWGFARLRAKSRTGGMAGYLLGFSFLHPGGRPPRREPRFPVSQSVDPVSVTAMTLPDRPDLDLTSRVQYGWKRGLR